MVTHTGPTSHWVEAGSSRLAITLWGHTLDQHHTGLMGQIMLSDALSFVFELSQPYDVKLK